MKNLTQTILIVTAFVVIQGCSNDFIELAPFSEANVNSFYSTKGDFENAVNATYDVLQDGRLYASGFEFLLEVRSDNGQFTDPASGGGVAFSLDNFTNIPDNSYSTNAYQALFQGVNRANIVLSRINNVDFDPGIKDRFIGEVKFLRALYYFHLVQLFGDLPLISQELTVSEIRALSRRPEQEIYDLIVEDLESAVTLLPDSYSVEERGRATNWAAAGLLSKVHLTLGNLDESEEQLLAVIRSGNYGLLGDINQVFSPTNEYNQEIIFAARFLKGGTGEGHGLSFNYTQNPTVDPLLIDSYDPMDARLPLVQYVPSSGGGNVPAKYDDVLSASNDVGLDIPILRYADILLMYAEVLNEKQYSTDDSGTEETAFWALNGVRTRAGLTAYTATDLPNQIKFREAVEKERRWELALEFHRWYDLKRTERAIDVFAALGQTIDECKLFYPIPQSEIDVFNNPSTFPQNDCF